MKTITLETLQNKLPIRKEKVRDTFTFRSWRMPEEKEISKLRAKHKGLGRFVRETFDFMLNTFNGQKWKDIDESLRKIKLNQMPFANIFYMWFYLRFEALGETFKMQAIDCPYCHAGIQDVEVDLNTLEIKCNGFDEQGNEENEIKDFDEYILKKPIEIGEIVINKLRFSFTPWNAMEKLSSGERNIAMIKSSALEESLVGAFTDGVDNMLQLDKSLILENLSKKDFEGYYKALDAHNGGPVMNMQIKCPHCEKEFFQPLNWTYEYFFENSSL